MPEDRMAHAVARFELLADGPIDEVGPLFGAERERSWAPGWNPRFIHPTPAADAPGMVFTVAHGEAEAVWVNTQLDWKAGVVQYVYVLPEKMATLITLWLRPEGRRTRVEVEYQRTALRPDASAHVLHLSEKDRAAGPEWQRQIDSSLGRRR